MKHIDLLHLCQVINLKIFDEYANYAFTSQGIPLSQFIDSDAHLVDDDSLKYNSSNRRYFDQYNYIKTKHTISENYQLLDIVTYNDLYHINESYETSGFLGVIFQNIETNEVVVVFRSTDAELGDVMTDLDIGLWSKIALQQICAYRLVNNRLDVYTYRKFKKLYVVGHSLGGALAQFAYLTYKRDIPIECITFNNLGVGYSYIKNNLNKFMSKVPSTLIDPYIHTKLPDYEDDKNIDGRFLLHHVIKRDIIKLVNGDNPLGMIYDKELGPLRLQLGFGGAIRSNSHPVKPIDLTLPVEAYSRLYEDFIYIKRHLRKLQTPDNLSLRESKSYILSTDWVPCINEQLGYTIILDKDPAIGYLNYKYNDSYKAIKKFGFKYHGLHLFKPYLDSNGYFITNV